MSHIDDGTLHAYLDGECNERERAQVEEHLSGCTVCTERLQEAKALGRRASDLLAELEPGHVQAPPWHELEERAAARMPGKRRIWVRPSLAWAAAIIIAFGLGWLSRSSLYEAPGFSSAERQPEPRSAVADYLRRSDESSEADQPVEPEEAQPAAQTAAGRTLAEGQQLDAQDRAKDVEEAGEPPAAAERGEQIEVQQGDRAAGDAAARERAAPALATPTEREAERKQEGQAAENALQRVRATQPTALADEGRPDQERIAGVEAPSPTLEATANESGTSSFFNVTPQEAALWLGGPLRELPDLQLMSVEVGPGGVVAGSLDGRPLARLSYADAAGHVIVLTQQRLDDAEVRSEDRAGTLVVDPSGMRAYRWTDRGYRLILMGTVSSDSLRALAHSVR